MKFKIVITCMAALFCIPLCNQGFSQQYYGAPYSNVRLGDCGYYGQPSIALSAVYATDHTRAYRGAMTYGSYRSNCPQDFEFTTRRTYPAQMYSTQYAAYSSCPNQSCSQQDYATNTNQRVSPFQRGLTDSIQPGLGFNQSEFADQRPQLLLQDPMQRQNLVPQIQNFQNSQGSPNELIPPPQLPPQTDPNVQTRNPQNENRSGTILPQGSQLIPPPNLGNRFP